MVRTGEEKECRKGLHVDGACKEEWWWETNEEQCGDEMRCLQEGLVREWVVAVVKAGEWGAGVGAVSRRAEW